MLRIFLFQSLRVFVGSDQPLDLGSPTTRSLIAYLTLHRAQPVDRRRLAFMFWPRASESAARRNLRQYLHRVRRVLDVDGLEPDLLLADGSIVQISPQAQVWVDVEAFRHGVRAGASIKELQTAVDLYSGELLEDLYEDWCTQERTALHRSYLNALDRLTHAFRACGQPQKAIEFAARRVVGDAFNEAAHRDLIKLYTLIGDRGRAVQQYHTLKESLLEELGTEPSPQTQKLFESIQKGKLSTDQEQLSPPISIRDALPPSPPLVGRQAEIDKLISISKRANRGEGGFVLVSGESGIGKTRLVGEFLSLNPHIPTLQGTCHELEARTPYAPLRAAVERSLALLPESSQLVPSWLGALAPLIPALAQRFPNLSNAPPASEQNTQVADAFSSLVFELASQHNHAPLHLVLDNVHWADSRSWELLVHLSRRAAHTPLVIMGLCRMEDLSSEQRRVIRTLERNQLLNHLELERLSKAETVELASHLIDESGDDPLFAQRLYQETEGNPFFIIETLRAVQEADWKLSYLGLQDEQRVPTGIQQVVEARLDRLSSESRELLGAAAVIGRAFTFSFIKTLNQVPEDQVIAGLEEWVQRGLVREEEGGYDFSHDKIRQVAYNNLSRARRQIHHRRIARALERAVQEPEAATLAHHYANSDQPLKALPYLTAAGERALQARSYEEARQFGLQAVNLLGQMPGPRQRGERVDLNLQLSQAYAFTGDLQSAREILINTEELAAGMEDVHRLAEVFRRCSQIYWLQGQPEVAGDYARRTLRIAENLENTELLHAALRMLGRVGIALSAFDDAIAHLRRYIRLENRSQKPQILPIVQGYLGVAYTLVGSWERGLDAARQGLERALVKDTQQTIAFARMQLAFVHAEGRDWETCWEVLESIPDPTSENGDLTQLGFMTLGLKGRTLAHLGRAAEGLRIIRSALAWSDQVEYRIFHYLPRFFLAECLLKRGDTQAAWKEAQTALHQAQATGDRWAAANLMRLLAEISIRRPYPQWEQAEAYLGEARNTLRQVRARPDLARTYLALRKLYDRVGQIAWAVDCHFRAVTIFEELGMRREIQQARGKAAGERRGAVAIPNLQLKGPNI